MGLWPVRSAGRGPGSRLADRAGRHRDRAGAVPGVHQRPRLRASHRCGGCGRLPRVAVRHRRAAWLSSAGPCGSAAGRWPGLKPPLSVLKPSARPWAARSRSNALSMARRGCAGRTAAKKPVGEGPGERVQGWVQNADCQQPLHRREPRGERDQSRGPPRAGSGG